mmetsp:Transcript_5249/g.16456  ORF Transcript_5249/g.16456 Transcript_5249/m.16456 type:complete len:234 (-) Transcript_5249:477-1178(-)
MPAFAIVIVCCSITSWIAVRSASSILSNSSMQHTPMSASTSAPPSRTASPVCVSRVTAAVRPTPDEPRPVVEMASGAMPRANRRICDFAVEGSPTISTLMSPRRCVPLARFFSTPPSSMSSSACFTSSCPYTDGASERTNSGISSFDFASLRMFFTSVSVHSPAVASLESSRTWLPSTRVRYMPVLFCLAGSARKMPHTRTRSPGLHESTSSFSIKTSTERGSWPGGARSGIS